MVVNSKLFNLNLNKESNEKDFSKLSSDLRSFGQVPRINFTTQKTTANKRRRQSKKTIKAGN